MVTRGNGHPDVTSESLPCLGGNSNNKGLLLRVTILKAETDMNKLTLMLAAVLFTLSATSAQAMDGYADRANEAKSFPNKTVAVMVDIQNNNR